MYRPGELDTRIDIVRENRQADGIGGETITHQLIARQIAAKFRQMTGREGERYDAVVAEEMAVFVIRYREDIAENDVVKWRGQNYNIRRLPPTSPRERPAISTRVRRGVHLMPAAVLPRRLVVL